MRGTLCASLLGWDTRLLTEARVGFFGGGLIQCAGQHFVQGYGDFAFPSRH